ncbi:MAG: potassium channel family protein [Nitrospiraceae bacterium]|nr:ion channel [Nitrospira cf. moscoviensis SBR1015]MBX9658143.1 potassium channel family protein [Nitrospiraceae bacterium]
MITITTVGYGDIAPVTPRARLIDAFIVTPVRIAVWLMFLGTAYQLIIRR